MWGTENSVIHVDLELPDLYVYDEFLQSIYYTYVEDGIFRHPPCFGPESRLTFVTVYEEPTFPC
jgi:hypothetical protein